MLYIKPSVTLVRAKGKIQLYLPRIFRMRLHRHRILSSSIIESQLDKCFLGHPALVPNRLKNKIDLRTYYSRNILYRSLYLIHDVIRHRTVRSRKGHLYIYVMVIIDLHLVYKSQIINIYRNLRIINLPESHYYISFQSHFSFLQFFSRFFHDYSFKKIFQFHWQSL